MPKLGLAGMVCLFALAVTMGACAERAHMEHQVGGKIASQVFSDSGIARMAIAACEGDVSTVEQLLRDGVDANGRGLQGVTPLLWAGDCGALEGVEALLKGGADPNRPIEGGHFTPVLVAAGGDRPELLVLLLRYGGDPDARPEKGGDTALMAALGVGMDGRGWRNYYALLDAGADVNLVHSGTTIAEHAANLSQYDKVYELMDRGYRIRLDTLEEILEYANQSVISTKQLEWFHKVERRLKYPN